MKKLLKAQKAGQWNNTASLPEFNLPVTEVVAEAPLWVKYVKEYEKKNPKSEYVSRYISPLAKRLGNTETNYPARLDQEYEQKALDYASKQLIKAKPKGKLSRAEWLNSLSPKEEELVKRNPKFQSSLWDDTKRGLISLVETNPVLAFQNILKSKDFSEREKGEMLSDYADSPILSKLGDAAKIFSPITVGSKVLQSAYRDDTTLAGALRGEKNDASALEDFATDLTNLSGLGIGKNILKASALEAIPFAGSAIRGLKRTRFPHITNSKLGVKQLSNSNSVAKSILDNPTELEVIKNNINLSDNDIIKLEKYLDETYDYTNLTPFQKKKILDRETYYLNKNNVSVDQRIQNNKNLLTEWENYKKDRIEYFNSPKFRERVNKQYGKMSDEIFKDFKEGLLQNLEKRPYIRPDVISEDAAAHYKPEPTHKLGVDDHKYGHTYYKDAYASDPIVVFHEGRHQLTNAEDNFYFFPSRREIEKGLVHPDLLKFDSDLTNPRTGADYFLSPEEFIARLDELKRDMSKVGYDYKTMDLTPEIIKQYRGLSPKEAISQVTGKPYGVKMSELTPEQHEAVIQLLDQAPEKTTDSQRLLRWFKDDFLLNQINNKWGLIPPAVIIGTEALQEQKNGGMIKRKDGSYSRRGLWDNIRDNAGSGKKPTAEMLKQERKIRNEEKEYGGSLPTSTLGVPYQDKEYMYKNGGEKEDWLTKLLNGTTGNIVQQTIRDQVPVVGPAYNATTQILENNPSDYARTVNIALEGLKLPAPFWGDLAINALQEGVSYMGNKNPVGIDRSYKTHFKNEKGPKYQEGGNTDYNLNRAKELGYTTDEAGHLPSVDYTTGMWLKSKKHPTAFLEYLEAILNPELQNRQVVVNPEGYFGNEQLQYVPKKETGGTNPPIIVRDPKDPRLQLYQDSLSLSNKYPEVEGYWKPSAVSPEYFRKVTKKSSISNIKPIGLNPYKGDNEGLHLPVYKTPDQAYVLEEDSQNNKFTNLEKILSKSITEIPYNTTERDIVPLDIPISKPKRNPPQKFYYGKDEKQEKRRLAGKPYTAVNSSGAEIYIASGDTRLNSDPENTIGYNRGRAYVEGDRIEDFEPARDTQNNPISKKQTGGNIYDKETDNLLAQIASMIADGEDPDMVAGSLVNNGYSEEVVDSLVEEAIDRLTELGDYEEEDINQLEDIKVLREGGIPDRYKNQGFTKVGAKRKSNRPGKKWMVLAKKGNKYKIVHGGYKGMKDYTQHGSEERRERFWDRMGGKNSSKAKDPFSPLYWHKRFGTWQDGGKTPIEHPEGQRKFPGKTTRIPSNRITMEGINYPVLAIGDNGKANLMLPGEEYLYLGVNYVDEVPFSK